MGAAVPVVLMGAPVLMFIKIRACMGAAVGVLRCLAWVYSGLVFSFLAAFYQSRKKINNPSFNFSS